MLRLVNEELMSFSTMNYTDQKAGRSFSKIKIVSSNKLQQYKNNPYNKYGRNNNEAEVPKAAASASVTFVNNNDLPMPINREIMRVSANIETTSEVVDKNGKLAIDLSSPMSVNVDMSNSYQPKVEVRSHSNGEDRANIYVVAFPFNGMIKPIQEHPQYRIYKGAIVSSARPILFNNRRYRKVLYLVIEINKNLFNADHKFHTNKINIQLESFALFENKETQEKNTNHEVFNLEISDAVGTYTTSWNYEVVPEAIMMQAGPGTPLWTTFNFSQPVVDRYAAKKENKKPRPAQREGNMLITTNRHGIRKETPIGKGNNAPKTFAKDKDYVPNQHPRNKKTTPRTSKPHGTRFEVED